MSYTRLTRDFYQAVEALMEGKVEEKLDPQASEGGGSHPKTDRHQKLAAMGHPKDKITHKDVLIARGVVAKEEAEIEEAELEEGKETDDMMVKSFKPDAVKALDKRGVTKHAPYKNPGLEKLAAQKKAMKEDAEEQLDELSKSTLGSYVKKRVKQLPSIEMGRQMAEPGRQLKDYTKLKKKVNTGIGRAVDKMSEEAQEEVDQIITENNSFEIEVPAQLSYKDYLDAAMSFVDAEDALTVAEAFYNEQDESLVIESFVRSDIEQKVAVHQKAGNQVSMPKFGTKDGKPYAEYVVTNKDDGIRRKYIHHGTMRRVENMGARGKKDAD